MIIFLALAVLVIFPDLTRAQVPHPGALTLRCPAAETASVDESGRYVVPDLVAAGLVTVVGADETVIAQLVFQQQPPPGTAVETLGPLMVVVRAFDRAGTELGSCTGDLLVRDTTRPLVTAEVQGLRWYGLPAFQVPGVQVEAHDNRGLAALEFLVDDRRVPRLTPELFGPGHHCLGALAVDESGNTGVGLPTCFFSHETVIHEPALHVSTFQCRGDGQGGALVDLEAILVPPSRDGRPAFQARDIVPTMVEFRLYDERGAPAAERQILMDGARDDGRVVEGVQADDCAAVLRASQVPVATCPVAAQTWGHALHPGGWLMRFAATAPLDPPAPLPGQDLFCGHLVPQRRVSVPRPIAELQPPTHPRDEPPPHRREPPRLSAPPAQCECQFVRNATSTRQERHAGSLNNTCSLGERTSFVTAGSYAGSPGGHSRAIDNCPAPGAAGPAAAFAVSHRLEEVSIQCSPKACPECCAPTPIIVCAVSGSFPISAGLEPGGQAIAEAQTDISGCITTGFGKSLNITTEMVTITAGILNPEFRILNTCYTNLFAVNSALLSVFADGGIWDDAQADAQFAWTENTPNVLNLTLTPFCSQVDP